MDEGIIDTEALFATLQELAVTFGLRTVGAIAMLIAGWMLARLVRRSLTKFFGRTDFDETLEIFITSLVYWMLLAFVGVAVLGIFGVQTTSMIAVLGTIGLAIGLAMQGSLSNFAAGVMLMIFRPFRVGDSVEVGGVSGTIFEIGIFATTMNTGDNIRVIVPNGAIYGEVVKNYSFNDTRRNDMVIGISYEDDIQVAIDTIRRVLGGDSRVLSSPEPLVAVSDLGDSSVNLVVRPWCKREDYWSLRRDLQRRLKEQLENSGCHLPYPQRDVHLYRVGGGD